MIEELKKIIAPSSNRFNLWSTFITKNQIKTTAEIGVYKGDFAVRILSGCTSIEKYYMIDRWRDLEDWNKPANKSDSTFESFLEECKNKTESFSKKRIILRGKTTEVIDQIPDNFLDFIYVDGDHTLKGITIDLLNAWTKVKEDGFIGGDDFHSNIWQHSDIFEPTLVFPFAVYFAEAVGAKIFALPFNQFLIIKTKSGFKFIDFTNGKYNNRSLKNQFSLKQKIKNKLKSINTIFR
jgi:hypothetical protein